jgi:AcrR family transcriptional regulator
MVIATKFGATMADEQHVRKSTKHRPETSQKRREILKAASEVFGLKGTSNGTLEEIADRVGMTRAGILHHFGSKRGLLLAVLQYRDTSEVENLEEHHIPSGAALFRHLIETARRNASRPGITRTFVTLSSESITDHNAGHDYFLNRYTNLREEITQALIDMAKERKATIDMAKADKASSAILAVMDGLQLQWLLDGEHVELAETTEYAMNALVWSVMSNLDEQAF